MIGLRASEVDSEKAKRNEGFIEEAVERVTEWKEKLDCGPQDGQERGRLWGSE